jgi:hypothetical protein
MSESAFTAADLADCAEREVRQRQRVYPRLILSGRMTLAQSDRPAALRQAIARKLRAEADAEGAKGDCSAMRRCGRECCSCLSRADASECELARPTG